MSNHPIEIEADAPCARDVAAERICLSCTTAFWSEGFGERICKRCKGTTAWRTSVPAGGGSTGRRRSGGSSL
ncbi:hypothetical protein OCH239_12555 [Roseivivax halodurans JCM 10272]|uniref:Uncharacterized protein n=1 Tax=Roseivivax halodurans JCM 10272 TaxID=1449350 RepID=X7EB05_9RHOB|nr:hypothetical protein [Roseivivax halodurans]ETX13269.1 hypothetical protein OCH239_12555 [Roseivivax halodurans JCM 10272]